MILQLKCQDGFDLLIKLIFVTPTSNRQEMLRHHISNGAICLEVDLEREYVLFQPNCIIEKTLRVYLFEFPGHLAPVTSSAIVEFV